MKEIEGEKDDGKNGAKVEREKEVEKKRPTDSQTGTAALHALTVA